MIFGFSRGHIIAGLSLCLLQHKDFQYDLCTKIPFFTFSFLLKIQAQPDIYFQFIYLLESAMINDQCTIAWL